MQEKAFVLNGAQLSARASGALWWAEAQLLCVSDLHLGKSERVARRSGGLLPPYETQDTLDRLSQEIETLQPQCVICLGDSFDDLSAALALSDDITPWIARLTAGRNWIWIEGNHDPGPLHFGGTHMLEYKQGPLVFRHIALPNSLGEVSGHYHPKAQLTGPARACFLRDANRVVMPAFGTYTGGLLCTSHPLRELMHPDATAIFTGKTVAEIPAFKRSK